MQFGTQTERRVQFGTQTERRAGTCDLEHPMSSKEMVKYFLSLLTKYWAEIAAKRFASSVERFVKEQSA